MSSEHEHILKHQKEKIEHLYATALSKGKDRSVVVVLDVNDERARRLAEFTITKEEVQDLLTRSAKDGTSACLMTTFSRDDAINGLVRLAKDAKSVIESCPSDKFMCLIVSDGAAVWFPILIQ